MARQARNAPGGIVYHVVNRAAGQRRILRTDADFAAFERVIAEAHARYPLEIFAYCLLGNHWHFLVRPAAKGDLSAFFRWLTLTHAVRWRVAHRTVGHGPLYQGRFKCFPVQADRHFLIAGRYVERNALSAGLIEAAERWRWGSLFARPAAPDASPLTKILAPWPVERPRDWVASVNRPMNARDLEHVRTSVKRGRPLGDADWTARTVRELSLMHSLRGEGRPAKTTKTPRN